LQSLKRLCFEALFAGVLSSILGIDPDIHKR